MYQLAATNSVKRISDGALIPFDLANTDYQAFLAWQSQGNTPQLAPQLTPEQILELERAQMECSRFQAKAALALAGKLTAADAVVAASTDAVVKLAWADATVFKRNSPSINGLASAIGLTQADLDDLFRTAAGIVA